MFRCKPNYGKVVRSQIFLLLFFVSLTIALQSSITTQAASFIVVTTFTDDLKGNDGFCSLREAIIAANTDKRSGRYAGECPVGSGDDTIIVPAGHYVLTRTDNGQENASQTGDLDIYSNVTIIGDGSAVTTVTGVGINDRIVHVLSNTVNIQGLTFKGGRVPGNGGALASSGNLTLHDVALLDSTATNAGGGLLVEAGTLTGTAVTIANNNAQGNTGGVWVTGGALSLTNSTISGNSASDGQTLLVQSPTTLHYVTVQGNTAVTNATLTLDSTILAGSCTGNITSAGYNLIQSPTCTISGDLTGNILGQDPHLQPLADNGGGVLTHALAPESPAIEAGNNATCPTTDQRGISRPRGLACDSGAFELENPVQTGPTLHVNTADDLDDGICDFAHCSFREAIHRTNTTSSNTITFAIPGDNPPTIFPLTPLPTITSPVTIDGTTQPGGWVVLDGSQAGPDAVGLHITAGSSTVRGLRMINFGGDGLLLTDGSNNQITGNEIAHNGGNGITIIDSTGNQITGNDIHDNGGLSIDLNGDGRTTNDTNDPDSGANWAQNFPVLIHAIPQATTLHVAGRLNSQPNTTYTLEFFAGATCGSGSQTSLGTTQLTTDASGNGYFQAEGLTAVPLNHFLTATATDPLGNTSELSDCITVSPGNISWITALRLNVPADLGPTAVDQYLDQSGQSRWYKFTVQPGSKLIVTLTNLPANYDLTIYKDIAQAYNDLLNPSDLPQLDAEFAPEAFSPEVFSPEVFSPEAFSPEAFSPEAFSPEVFSPEVFSPEAFSPEVFSPEVFSPEVFSPDAFSPEAFSPEAFSPEAFSPEAFSPEVFSPEAFSSAQLRSLLGASAFRGTANEGIIVNTWNNTGDFYIRVRGANGAYSLQQPFHMTVELQSGSCGDVAPITTASSTTPTAANYQTIILTDMVRMEGSPAEKVTLLDRLAAFAARPEVAGVLVDVGADARVAAANAQADAHLACPYAKNLVAASIKEIVDGYRALNPLAYVVLVGNDGVIPFFRYPDNALLANENNYVPPVSDNTASQASLRLGYVLGQDEYGSETAVSFKNSAIPIPELAVGRLVETAVQATVVLDAYLATANGVTTLTTPPLVTGYDFLEDAALAVQAELEAGTGFPADTLIAPSTLAPSDPAAWTATDLRTILFNGRHDLIYLAGHFSASGALAADYQTRMTARELLQSTVDLQNAIIFSAGCHSGYNIVDADGVPFVTEEPDWAQAFASKGALLIGGTGYQYGDTEFLEYSERLYHEFSAELRTGSGPVSVGQALVAAKITYLAETPFMRGIHEKVLLQSAIFGLPHLSINMPGDRLPTASSAPAITNLLPAATAPGTVLGLQTADLTLNPTFNTHTVNMTNLDDDSTVTATYLTGGAGLVTNPAEPTLPLELLNVGAAGTYLRGVGFRGGAYTDLGGIIPFTGAPTTEIRGVHAPFQSDIFYPVQFWRVNYFGQLADDATGQPMLAVTPAQFVSEATGAAAGTLRRFDQLNFRLFYSDNIANYGGDSQPAQTAPPTIVSVSATPQGSNVQFAVDMVGNPAAGIQEVWVTYTAVSGPYFGLWQPLDLTQNPLVSTRWEGTLPLNGTDPLNMRYMVHAANGVGLVSMAANVGDLYIPGIVTANPTPTALTLSSPPVSGVYGSQVQLTAQLSADSAPLADQRVTFGLGPQSQTAVTDANGNATVTLTLLGLPGEYEVRVSFAGNATYAPTATSTSFTIYKQDTLLTLMQPAAGYATDDTLLTAILSSADGRRLSEKTLIFVLSGPNGSVSRAVITDYAGQATLGNLPLPPGEYSVTVYFNGTILLSTGEILTLNDARYNPSTANGSLTLYNQNPICNAAFVDPIVLWPANNELYAIDIRNIVDPDGSAPSLLITAIRQDEPVGKGRHSPDGFGVGTSVAQIRAERDGNGNGRVYHIYFTATDTANGSCSGMVRLPIVPHDQSAEIDAFDEGPLYDSTSR